MKIKTKIQFFCSMLLLCSFFVSIAHAGVTRSIVFPVNGDNHFQDDFGDARSGGRVHEGVDIIAKKMTPVVAATDGVIVQAPQSEPSYGFTLVLRDTDGYSYHYIHLNNDTPGTDDGAGGPQNAYASGIVRGVTVRAGQQIAWVGDSGNAESIGAHLHFELHTPEGIAVDPYESLITASKPGEPIVQKFIVNVPTGGKLIKYASGPELYLLANDAKYLIVDTATLKLLGYSASTAVIIPESQQYRSGLPMQIGPTVVFVRDGKILSATAAANQSPVFISTLKVGSEGSEVTALQRELTRLGFYSYIITGYFGSRTQDAVMKFQKAHGIEMVGFVGPKTRAALNGF